jgi:hypothetical protein
MGFTHWAGSATLLINAFIFTENTTLIVIQISISFLVMVYDLDEKIWGGNKLKDTGDYLQKFQNKILSQDVPAKAHSSIYGASKWYLNGVSWK